MPIAFRFFLPFALVVHGLCAGLEPPKGWTLADRAPLLVYESVSQSNRGLRIEMRDSEAPDGDLQKYLENKFAELQYPAEATAKCRPRERRPGREVSCNTTSSAGAHTFYAIRTDDGQFRFVHVLATPTLAVMLPQLMNTKRILDAAEKNVGRSEGMVASSRKAPTATESPKAAVAASSWGDAPKEAQTAVPSPSRQGSSRAGSYAMQVEGLYLHLKYTTGVGGGVYPEYRPYLYFRDGTVTTDLAIYPTSAAEMDAWRKRRPGAWGRWTRNGETIRIEWNQVSKRIRKPETLEKWFVAQPGPRGMQLQGRYQSLGGGGNTAMGGDAIAVAWKNFEFQPGSKVETGAGAFTSSGGGGTGVGTSTRSQRPTEILSYQIDGNRIDFIDARGQRRSHWFFLFPKDDNVLGVANSVYNKSKKR